MTDAVKNVEVTELEAFALAERDAEWRRLYEEEHWSCGLIAKQYGVTRQAVSLRLNKMPGIKMRPQRGPTVHRELIVQLAKDKRAALSLPEICKTVGNSWIVVKRILVEEGLLEEVRERSQKRIIAERVDGTEDQQD